MSQQYPIVGNYAPDFELLGTDNNVHHLGNYLTKDKAALVIFVNQNNQESKNCLDILKQWQIEFKQQGLFIVAINSQDTLEEMQNFLEQNPLNFPYLRDSNQDVGQSYQVMMKPEVFLIDQEAKIRYRGQLNNPWDEENKSISEDLKNKIQELLS